MKRQSLQWRTANFFFEGGDPGIRNTSGIVEDSYQKKLKLVILQFISTFFLLIFFAVLVTLTNLCSFLVTMTNSSSLSF